MEIFEGVVGDINKKIYIIPTSGESYPLSFEIRKFVFGDVTPSYARIDTRKKYRITIEEID